MYKVIKTESDCEPWWFLEDWEEDITEISEFEQKEDAIAFFKEQWNTLKQSYPFYSSKRNLLATFWDTNEKTWCEECDEYLQDFHSILLLKDEEPLTEEEGLDFFEQGNATTQSRTSCQFIK